MRKTSGTSAAAGGARLRQRPAWKALEAHHRRLANASLRGLFDADPTRADRYRAEAAGWRLDYAKHRVDDQALAALFALARDCDLETRRDAMFGGAHVNVTERRAALHVALRAPPGSVLPCDGVDVVAGVQAVLSRMARFAEAIRDGSWRGYSGRPIRNVVNIGIGGSHLGPAMADLALRHYAAARLRMRYVSNVDYSDLAGALRGLQPAETLFIVSSKTFTTLETMTNAHSARAWLLAAAGRGRDDAVAHHFAAVTTNAGAAGEFGIPEPQTFGFWDWVGGRYSMDSAIGLSTMIAVGEAAFREMLAGFHAMDRHFREAPLAHNLPAIMGLLNVWYTDLFKTQTVAVLPYAQALRRLPAYLQQLTMESNGKRVTGDGRPVDYSTGPIFWGEPGTNGQHSFYQLLHQGTPLVPCDFIAFAEPLDAHGRHHDLLIANLIAQAEALAFGKSAEELTAEGTPEALVAHKVCTGNRPSGLLLARRLTPYSLGALIAAYEHSVFTQAAVWEIDPFDQWGVELGKQLATRIAGEIAAPKPRLTHDSSTNAAIHWYRGARRTTARRGPARPRTLVLDVGGTHVKALATGRGEEIKIVSGPRMTPQKMVTQLRRRLRGRRYDRVSIGIPAPVVHGRLLHDPLNLGSGWTGFDYAGALGVPVRLINDAAMQALGSYDGGRMLFLGLGTGLGSAMIVDGLIQAMEIAHLPYRKHTYEYYVAESYREKHAKKWRDNVFEIIDVLRRALEPEYIVLGGGNVDHLNGLPDGVRRGDNANAFTGGFRLWED